MSSNQAYDSGHASPTESSLKKVWHARLFGWLACDWEKNSLETRFVEAFWDETGPYQTYGLFPDWSFVHLPLWLVHPSCHPLGSVENEGPSCSTEHGKSSPHLYGHVKQNVAWAKIHKFTSTWKSLFLSITIDGSWPTSWSLTARPWRMIIWKMILSCPFQIVWM